MRVRQIAKMVLPANLSVLCTQFHLTSPFVFVLLKFARETDQRHNISIIIIPKLQRLDPIRNIRNKLNLQPKVILISYQSVIVINHVTSSRIFCTRKFDIYLAISMPTQRFFHERPVLAANSEWREHKYEINFWTILFLQRAHSHIATITIS